MTEWHADLPQPGDVVAGKYRVHRILGEGGMGIVFEVEHTQLGQRLAMKVLHPKIKMVGEVIARFVQEARAASRLRSEHVIHVSDVDALPDGRPFMVMELVSGHDLAQELEQRGRLPPAEAVGRVLEACAGLVPAHAAGIVHRDLKPSNLFVADARGGPCLKLLDFGISKVTDAEDVGLTQTQSVFGTPVYMSPEHLRSAKKVDARSDLWALGVILYELLSGRIPFEGDSVTALAASISLDEVPPLGVPDLPEGLEVVVRRLLAKDPAGRYQTVAELAVALTPFADEDGQLVARKIQKEAGGTPPPSVVASPPRAVAAKTSTIAPTTAAPRAPSSMRAGILVGVGLGGLLLVAGLAWKAMRPQTVGTATISATGEPRASVLVQPATSASSAAPPAPAPVDEARSSPRATTASPSARPSASPTASPSAAATGAPTAAAVAPTATAVAPPPPPPRPPPTPAENPTIL